MRFFGFSSRNRSCNRVTGMSKKMREAMPMVASWVDDLRAAFGQTYIDGAIRAGLQGRPVFWAQEGGHELGTKPRAMQHDEAAAAAQPKDTKG